MENHKILVLYTTIGNEEAAEELIRHLLAEKLIACGVSWPVRSQYHWKEKTVTEGEYAVIMKSSLRHRERLETIAEKRHPYETPALLFSETEVNVGYFEWVEEETQNNDQPENEL